MHGAKGWWYTVYCQFLIKGVGDLTFSGNFATLELNQIQLQRQCSIKPIAYKTSTLWDSMRDLAAIIIVNCL